MDSLTATRVHKLTQKIIKTADAAERARLIDEAEREGKGRLLTSFDEAVALIERWCDEFNDRPHRSLPKITARPAARAVTKPRARRGKRMLRRAGSRWLTTRTI